MKGRKKTEIAARIETDSKKILAATDRYYAEISRAAGGMEPPPARRFVAMLDISGTTDPFKNNTELFKEDAGKVFAIFLNTLPEGTMAEMAKLFTNWRAYV